MKRFSILLVLAAILATGCASQQKGCPGSNYYSSKNIKQNRKASKQMDRLF